MEIDTPPGYRWHYEETVASTSDLAKAAAEAGAPDGAVYAAGVQTAGRGRYGRDWASPPGNLYMSLVLRDVGPPADRAQLSFVAAVALGEVLSALAPASSAVTLKWPNDVLLDGRKVAGLLLEGGGSAAAPWLVLGVGVNVVAHPPADATRHPATSLTAAGIDIGADALAERFLAAFEAWRRRWRESGFAPVRATWLTAAAGLGAPVLVRLSGRPERRGVFRDLDRDGALVFDPEDGGPQERITAGEVHFPEPVADADRAAHATEGE